MRTALSARVKTQNHRTRDKRTATWTQNQNHRENQSTIFSPLWEVNWETGWKKVHSRCRAGAEVSSAGAEKAVVAECRGVHGKRVAGQR
jgi:hypothetical protein